MDSSVDLRQPSFRDALRFWLKLGFISFGGPSGEIAIMQTELVDRRRWIAHVFHPSTGQLDLFALGLSALAIFTILRWNISVVLVVLGGAIAGLLYRSLAGVFP